MSIDEFSRHIIGKIDLDRSNNLSFTEFLAACLVSEKHTIPTNVWSAVFSVLDTDDSGDIGLDDMIKLFGKHQLGEEGSNADLAGLLGDYGGLYAGQKPEDIRITFDDFLHLMQDPAYGSLSSLASFDPGQL